LPTAIAGSDLPMPPMPATPLGGGLSWDDGRPALTLLSVERHQGASMLARNEQLSAAALLMYLT